MDREQPASLVQHASPSRRHISNQQRILLAVVLILLCGVAVWLWMRPAKTINAQTPRRGFDPNRVIPVQASPVRQGDLKVYLTGLGTVTAANSVIVHPRVDGQLMKLYLREGTIVQTGQLLAEIDPRPFQVQLEQAEGQMARDQAQLQNAKVDLARYQGLLAEDSISSQQVDTQQALVRQDEGLVKSDQGAIDNAKLQLTYSRVTAPAGGRLGLRQVDVGNIVHASDANGIVTINQVEPINVLFTIPETQLPSVLPTWRKGNKLSVEAWDREQKNLLTTGYLSSIDNQIDLTTGTVKLKAEFGNKDAALFPNQFVNIRLLAETRQNDILAPNAAVQNGRGGTFVYVIKPDRTVTQRTVKTGPVDGMNVEIAQGLAPGELVVTDGIDQLREGAKVEVSDPTLLLKAKPPRTRTRGRGRGQGQNGQGQGDQSSRSAPQAQ
ncbi:MAG TPA: MdtA/MuxA family multidrug efflux RND transporter periplasmic adaptor subunit [Rhodocyclaceae bacterium]|nr:MdtA/MuxA family multidrug efflux RND transporter periplasmic adaptor subunit [Rhodocyclaceae bacterium]